MELLNDEYYMRLALQMAERTQGQTGINPVVGCVIVKEGRIVGMGAHLRMGSGHAEVNALQMAGAEAEGATVYVTLEPCSHYGRTPPCSDRLIAEKVARVVVGAVDPNPKVAGSGVARLRNAGIEVKVGILEQEATSLNEMFNKFIQTRLPFVTLKAASTLDGKLASRTGDSKWITGEEARAYVHMLRHRHQGIMVGKGTVLADDPKLTVRLPVPGLHPVRIVVDSALSVPVSAGVFQPEAETIVVTTGSASEARKNELTRMGITVLEAGGGPRVDLREAMRQLGQREIGSILLEGGGRLNGAMLAERLVDKCHLFFAPKIIGGEASPGVFQFSGYDRMSEAIRLAGVKVETFGNDICVTGYPEYSANEGDSPCLQA